MVEVSPFHFWTNSFSISTASTAKAVCWVEVAVRTSLERRASSPLLFTEPARTCAPTTPLPSPGAKRADVTAAAACRAHYCRRR
eukprot:1857292-Pleurochrysis_carterae.AAC.1